MARLRRDGGDSTSRGRPGGKAGEATLSLRTVTFGYRREGLLLHQWAHEHTSLAAVVIPANREEMCQEIKAWAEGAGIPVLVQQGTRDPLLVQALASIAPDFILVHCYTYRLPLDFLTIPTKACLNLHPGRLPDYRGRDPIKAAMEKGETPWVTLHLMDEGYDTGPLIARMPVDLTGVTEAWVREHVTREGLKLLERWLSAVAEGTVTPTPQTFEIPVFPEMVVMSVSFSCQAHCPACPYTNNPAIEESYKEALFMPGDVWCRIADEAGPHRAWLRISGREPTLHPHLLPLIDYAKRAGCRVALNTNGARLDESYSRALLSAGLDAVEISVDAADSETYARVRPGLDFRVLLQNVRALLANRNRMRAECNIVVSIVDSAAVHDRIGDIVEFWRPHVDNVAVRKYLTWGFLDRSQAGNSTPYMGDNLPCPFPFERLNIDTRGDIFFCGHDIAGKVPLGNVMKEPIASVWGGPAFVRWRQLLVEGRWDSLPLCENCADRQYRSFVWNWWLREAVAKYRRTR